MVGLKEPELQYSFNCTELAAMGRERVYSVQDGNHFFPEQQTLSPFLIGTSMITVQECVQP